MTRRPELLSPERGNEGKGRKGTGNRKGKRTREGRMIDNEKERKIVYK